MKELKRSFIFFVLLLMVMSMNVSVYGASRYRREWKTVEKYIEDDLTESAYDAVSGIFDKARLSSDGYQMLKSCVYLTRIASEYREDYVDEAFENLRSIQPLMTGLYEPLWWAVAGNCYRDYYERNRFVIDRAERLDIRPDDMSLWDKSAFLDTIRNCYIKSLDANSGLTRKTGSSAVCDLIKGGNGEGLKMRPGLYDALLLNALWDCPEELTDSVAAIFGEPGLYGTCVEFLETAGSFRASCGLPWNIDILSRIAADHAENGTPDLSATIDLERLEWLEKSGFADFDKIRKAYRTLEQEYFDRTPVAAVLAERYVSSIRYSENPEDMRTAVQICDSIVNRWPGSRGAVDCYNIALQLRQPRLELNVWNVFAAGRESLVELSHVNADSVRFRAVRGELVDESDRAAMAGTLCRLHAVAEWTQCLVDSGDFVTRQTLVEVPELPIGSYYIVCSSTELFDEHLSVVSYVKVNVNSFQFIDATAAGSTDVTGFVVDRVTGRPSEGCSYNIWEISGPYYNRKRGDLLYHGVTGLDGVVSAPLKSGVLRRPCEIEIIRSGEVYTADLNLSSRKADKTVLKAALFTDRFTYRPGDSLLFSSIVYEGDGHVSGRTVAEKNVRFILYDANMQEVDTLSCTTDAFGTASGEFVIQRNLLPGRYTLRIEGTDRSFAATKIIDVEEFRQPTFMVNMTTDGVTYTPGDSVKLLGSVMTYTGIPVNGAKVSYTVEYLEPRRFIFGPPAASLIVSGDTLTASDGKFVILFKAESGMASAYVTESLSFRVTAIVTDMNGETHSDFSIVTAGREAPYISLGVKDVYTSVPSVKMLLENAAGDLLEGDADVRVEKLLLPSVPKLDISRLFSSSQCSVSDGLRMRFPLYDFDRTVTDELPGDEVCSMTVHATAGQPCEFRIAELSENGVYRVTAKVSGYESSDTAIVVVMSADDARMPDNRLLVTVPLSDSCKVGDMAEILVGSAFAGTSVYYAVEDRTGLVKSGRLEMENGVRKLSFPITERMKGGISVRFGTVLECISATSSHYISVPYQDRKLNVSLVTFRDMLEPDTRETWELNIRDSEGNPVEASLMLSMYDSALDVYGTNGWHFFPWNDVRLLSSPLLGFERFRAMSFSPDLKFQEYKGAVPEYPVIVSPLDNYYVQSGRNIRMAYAKSSVMMVGALSENSAAVTLEAEEVFQDSAAGYDAGYPESDDAGDDAEFREDPDALRTDMNPTAFFTSGLHTDSKGNVKFSFTVPQLLTCWNVQGLFHTEDLKTAVFSSRVTTRKQLMIQPRAPRFVRQGDDFLFTSKVSNLDSVRTAVRVRIEITDSETGRPVNNMLACSSTKYVDVPAGESAEVSFRMIVPENINAFTYRIVASTKTHSDGQQETVPVLSRRVAVTESVSLFNNGNETTRFVLPALADNSLSPTVSDRRLTLEYVTDPMWYAVQALPYLDYEDNPGNERLFHKFFANTLSQYVISSNPVIAETLRRWAEIPSDDWQTQLDRNEDLKMTLLQETPWVMDSKDEKDNLHNLAVAFSDNRIGIEADASLRKLLGRQEADGGWAWIPGYRGDVWVTRTILEGIGTLVSTGALDPDGKPELCDAVERAIRWLDSKIAEEYNDVRKGGIKSVGENVLDWLLVRTRFRDVAFEGDTRDIYDFFMKVAATEDTRPLSLYSRASLALLMASSGNQERADALAKSLVERSLYDYEQGRWWRDNSGGYLWQENAVVVQVRIIEALLSVPGYWKSASECGRWLLKQKQTTHWSSSAATAKAVSALMELGNGDMLTDMPVSYIKVGRETVKAESDSDNLSGYIIRKWSGYISPSKGNVEIVNDHDVIGWGGLTLQYMEDVDKVGSSGNGISISRRLYRVDEEGGSRTLHEITEEDVLQRGDRVRVRMELSCDRNLEYVQVKDMRPASFEPVSTNAGFVYSPDGIIRAYTVPGNASQMFYIDRIERGRYLLEYDVYAEQSGHFASGTVSAQCMYAPEFRSTAGNVYVDVE